MISVALCKVWEPSHKKRKSYEEKFVITQCACINDGATLRYYLYKGGNPWKRKRHFRGYHESVFNGVGPRKIWTSAVLAKDKHP